jgi:hypothetical protein
LQLHTMGKRELGLAAIGDPRELVTIPRQQGRAGQATGGAQQHGDADALSAVFLDSGA